MDPDRPTTTDRAQLDDAALALLVRDVADEWSLPPQRLDALTWRDRVSRSRRLGGGGGASGWRWPRGLRGATAVAVAVVTTVSLSLAAVWLTAQRGDQGTLGSSPSPVGSSSPVPSGDAVPAASPMPKLFRNGDLPTPSRLMVRTGQGYHFADLATGELGGVAIEGGHGPTALLARPGGGWVCICGDGQGVIRLSITTVDANGVVSSSTPIRDITGIYNPTESDALQRWRAGVNVTASPDGRLALVGWIRRDGDAGWQIGADVIDLDTLATVASTEFLLDEPVVVDGRPRVRNAPIVRLSPAGDRILLASMWFVDDISGPGQRGGADHWLASFDGRSIGALADAGSTSSDVCLEFDAGLINVDPPTDDAVYYMECFTPTGPHQLRRIAADGRLVSATELPGALGGVDGTIAPPSGDALFSWNPFETVLSRVDLRSGELSVGQPQRPNQRGLTSSNNLIVVSADGTRVYTLGIASPDPTSRDSTGVYAFDAATLAPVGHWPAQADLTSISVSDDGRYVYAAADGGPSAARDPAPEFGASITAYDTSDGSVALIAGRLAARDLTLGEAICR